MSCCKEVKGSERICQFCGKDAQTVFPSITGKLRPTCIECAEKKLKCQA